MQQALGITEELTVITERVDNLLVLIASLEKLVLAVLTDQQVEGYGNRHVWDR